MAAKGLVTSKPKTGTRVNEVSCWSLLDPDVLAWSFESEPSEAFVRDLFELRMIIEPAVAELAAVRRDQADLTAMREALDAMSHHGLAKQEGREADQRFHRALLQAARNGPLLSLASSIEAAVAWTTAFKQRRRSLPPDPISEHRAVLESVERADPAGARAAMTQLVSLALDHTKAALRS